MRALHAFRRLFEFRSLKDPKTPIQFKFLCWLLFYASAAFVASLILSLSFATISSHKEVRQVISGKISDAYEHSRLSDDALKTIKRIASSTGLQRARAFSLTLQSNPSILVDGDFETTTINLGKVARMLRVDRVAVSNEKGIVIASWPNAESEIGRDLTEGPDALKYSTLLADPTKEFSLEIHSSKDAGDSALYQTSVVARRDSGGVIVLCFRAEEVEDAYRLANMSNYVSSVAGFDGFLWVYHGASAEKNNSIDERVSNSCSGQRELGVKLLIPSDTLEPTIAEDGQISGPKFTTTSVEELKKLPVDELLVRRLTDVSSDKAVPYLVFAQDRTLYEGGEVYRFVGGISQHEIHKSRRLLVYLLVLANFIVFFAVFALISKQVKHLIVDSVCQVNHSLEKITNGDLNERVAVDVSTEFVDLSNGVNATVSSLKQVVNEVKRRVERELLFAKKIQEEALPDLERLYSDRNEYDVYAHNRPMRSIGGDMYDFFYLDSDNILFYVADVSGHGIPGALIMMKTMALVKNLALSGYQLEEVVSITNNFLSENNDSSFVTGFFCIVNLRSGVIKYVNAGHNSPFIRQGTNNFVEFVPEINLILGVMPDIEYVSQTIQLEPGDEFVLFTDGITEATTPLTDDFFEVERALATLNAQPEDATAKASVEALFAAVTEFTNNEEPSDDETILYFHYRRAPD